MRLMQQIMKKLCAFFVLFRKSATFRHSKTSTNLQNFLPSKTLKTQLNQANKHNAMLHNQLRTKYMTRTKRMRTALSKIGYNQSGKALMYKSIIRAIGCIAIFSLMIYGSYQSMDLYSQTQPQSESVNDAHSANERETLGFISWIRGRGWEEETTEQLLKREELIKWLKLHIDKEALDYTIEEIRIDQTRTDIKYADRITATKKYQDDGTYFALKDTMDKKYSTTWTIAKQPQHDLDVVTYTLESR